VEIVLHGLLEGQTGSFWLWLRGFEVVESAFLLQAGHLFVAGLRIGEAVVPGYP
jgi:hypothetical protein